MRASRLSRYSWTMFDFANQPFYTLIMTFVFSVYFTDVFITGEAVILSSLMLTATYAAAWFWIITRGFLIF